MITAPPPAPAALSDGAVTARSPTLVVDLADPSGDIGLAPAPTGAASSATAIAAAAHPGAAAPGALSGDEQFAARVEGGQPDHASATVLHNRGQVVAQGAMIPAVLETALDSDLPGYARAVVTRDVRSFDGSAVLIPRGTRVVGEYHSAATLAWRCNSRGGRGGGWCRRSRSNRERQRTVSVATARPLSPRGDRALKWGRPASIP